MAYSDATREEEILSVDGQPGPFTPLLRAPPTPSLENSSLDGTHGLNAGESAPGEHGGYLSVELSPDGAGISVRVIKSEGSISFPERILVRERRQLRLAARGGDGAVGTPGGSGLDGRQGPDGKDATEEEEATNGERGGRGGNAGAGANGGSGGSGGTIGLIVSEEHTNLLLAVDFDVSGGKGGPPGENGKPGKAGPGGKGGKAKTWKLLAGHETVCTAACHTLSLVLPKSNATTLLPEQVMMGRVLDSMAGAAASTGRVSSALAAARIRQAGLCKCQGGVGTCAGCKRVPKYVTFNRSPGRDGFQGVDGDPSAATPGFGTHGIPGNVAITVVNLDGTDTSYTGKYTIDLVSFNIVDENDDGIIEPGEHLLIENIVVRNSGPMPTPTLTKIPLTIQQTDWIHHCQNPEESMIFLPTGIGPGETKTADGCIKVLIRPNDPKAFEKTHRATDRVTLLAVMPGINRKLPGFASGVKDIEIQYPVYLTLESNLQSVPAGSRATFSWKVHNRSLKTYGSDGTMGRKLLITATAEKSTGIQFSSPDARMVRETSAIMKQVTSLEPGKSATVSEEATIDPNASPYSRGMLSAMLAIDATGSSQDDRPQIIQTVPLEVQISSRYEHDPSADLVLITNSATSSQLVDSWRKYIDGQLGLRSDIFNISLYGSMQPPTEENEQQVNLFTAYSGKALIFLCNPFEFFSRGNRTAIDFCDPLLIAQEATLGTRVAFIVPRSHDSTSLQRWMSMAVFPIAASVERYGQLMQRSVTAVSDIIESIYNQFRAGEPPRPNLYKLPVTVSAGQQKMKTKQLQKIAKETLNSLEESLPQLRFMVKPSLTTGTEAELLIFQGLSRSGDITAQYSLLSPDLVSGDETACITSIPFHRRVEMVFKEPSTIPQARAYDLTRLSLVYELCRETQWFLRTASWPDTVVPSSADTTFLQLHFPLLSEFLRFYQSANLVLSPHALDALRAVISTTHPQDYVQLSARVVVPFRHRRNRLRNFFLQCFKTHMPSVISTTNPRSENTFLQELKDGVKLTPRKTRRGLQDQIGALTGQSPHEVEHGAAANSEIVASAICTEQDWQRRLEDYERLRERVAADVAHSSEVLGSRVRSDFEVMEAEQEEEK